MSQSIKDLKRASNVPAKQRAVKISTLVDKVGDEAYKDGLTVAALDELLDIIARPNEVDQASLSKLIQRLYPATKVPDATVIKVVSGLGHGRAKPSYSTQAALLRWLVMVYDVLDNPGVLSSLYSILFNLLDTVAIRMELTRQAGNDPPLVALMRVYKDYYPDVIVGDVTASRASVFRHPDQEWRQRLDVIQDIHFQNLQDESSAEQNGFRVKRADGKKSSTLPSVYTSNADESSTTLEEIENVKDFIHKLEKIELPNQLVSVVGDPLLQKLLQLKSTEATSQRIDNWLLAFFEDQLENPGSEAVILEMLTAIRDYTHFTKSIPPACLVYFKAMAESWDGNAGRDVILDLLSYAPLSPFKDVYESLLKLLEEAILEDGKLESQISLLRLYSKLLQFWIACLRSQPPGPGGDQLATRDLITHGGNLALTILQISQSVLTCSAVLDFYEIAASLAMETSLKTVLRITTPQAELIYTLYFTQSLSTVSRLCAVLALYKQAFGLAQAQKSEKHVPSYPKEYLNTYNTLLMDVCNLVWRSRAFNRTDTNANGCLLPEPLITSLTTYVAGLDTSISLPTLFNLSYSPLTCLLAISYIREREDAEEDSIAIRHAGPVTVESLKQLEHDGGLPIAWVDYRWGVLRNLETKGVAGVEELMRNIIKAK